MCVFSLTKLRLGTTIKFARLERVKKQIVHVSIPNWLFSDPSATDKAETIPILASISLLWDTLCFLQVSPCLDSVAVGGVTPAPTGTTGTSGPKYVTQVPENDFQNCVQNGLQLGSQVDPRRWPIIVEILTQISQQISPQVRYYCTKMTRQTPRLRQEKKSARGGTMAAIQYALISW